MKLLYWLGLMRRENPKVVITMTNINGIGRCNIEYDYVWRWSK